MFKALENSKELENLKLYLEDSGADNL